MKTDTELIQLAVDIYEGRVFTDRHLTDFARDVTIVFMPIMFMKPEQWAEMIADLGLIYEYLTEAGPRSINDMPMFMSFRTLSKDEAKQMFVHYGAYKSCAKNL